MAPSERATWLRSERFLARSVARPVHRFLHIEASGGVLLAAATVVALVWANSPWGAAYQDAWATELTLRLGRLAISEDLRHWINDGLMTLFFFVLGLEIKQEVVSGQLTRLRDAAVPTAGALGGMLVPAAVFVGVNLGGGGARGWGIPMATDIAIVTGVVAMLGSRVPAAVKVLLLTLAIVDDIGAIVVIAVFYSERVEFTFMIAAAVTAGVVAAMHRARIVYPPLIAAAGFALWLAVYESGVHATIAGVIMGLLMPAWPVQSELEADELVSVLERDDDIRANEVRATATLIRGSVSACDRLIDALHPWSSYLIVPIFALANAGIDLSGEAITSPSAVLTGVVVALVAGKFIGITLFSWIAVRLGFGRLPEGVRWGHVMGVGAVAGIGFTVSLFITGLAFDNVAIQDNAKIGILAASIIAALAGAALLAATARADTRSTSVRATDCS